MEYFYNKSKTVLCIEIPIYYCGLSIIQILIDGNFFWMSGFDVYNNIKYVKIKLKCE